MEAPMVRFLLRLAPAFLMHSAANAQAPPVVPEVPTAPPANSVVVPPPDTSAKSGRPSCDLKFSVPEGFGDLKEAPSDICDSAPDQTGSTTTIPNQPLSDPNDGGGR
jgi:hypothetical protein